MNLRIKFCLDPFCVPRSHLALCIRGTVINLNASPRGLGPEHDVFPMRITIHREEKNRWVAPKDLRYEGNKYQ